VLNLLTRGCLLFASMVLIAATARAQAQTVEIAFTSHDGHPMFGKLTTPPTDRLHPVVIYVQTAEGATVDMKRPLGGNRTFNYYDLYREKLPEMDVAFFSYEGRGIRMGDAPPRYEQIDWEIYNTSTLENKVRDILTAVDIVQKQKGIDPAKVFLMGASEGTLLAAEAAARAPDKVKGGLILYAILSTTLKDMLKYQGADGPFLVLSRLFDTDKDGRISRLEFETDAGKNRQRVLPNVMFETLDPDKDGFFTGEDYRTLRKPYLDAIEANNFEVIYAQLKGTAAVSLPRNWLEDHFAHPSMWTFLSPLTIPVGFFHGSADNLTPIQAVRNLEEQAKKVGKTNFAFRYFEGLDHSLNIGRWFATGEMPDGHRAIFEYIKNQTSK
jgi:uncharacterized protein